MKQLKITSFLKELFLAVLGAALGLSVVVVCGPLTTAASLAAERGL